MDKKRIVILGAGISGLTTAFYLRLFHPEAEVIVLEKSERVGGLIHTDHTSGFHFEKGPRTFVASRTQALLTLIKDLGLEKELITAEASKRYFFIEDQLLKFPSNLLEFVTSKLTRGCLKALFSEWRKAPVLHDESVYDFAKRRFNEEVASLIFDPIVVGIFGGDSREISIQACFATLKTFEKEQGSVLKGMWAKRKQKKESLLLPSSATYSLRGGADVLTQTLAKTLQGCLQLKAPVRSVENQGLSWKVILEDGREYTAERLISALPLQEMRSLFAPLAPDLIEPLKNIALQSLVILNLGYKKPVLSVEGFGYLTQYAAQKDVLGVIFDSCVFPQHNYRPGETRLTVLMRDKNLSSDDSLNLALMGLRESLHIQEMPDVFSMKRVPHAIPQYGVGHLEKMQVFEEAFNRRFPHCSLVGNYLCGPSVGNCVEKAVSVARKVSILARQSA